jgi:hypothetical protein
MFIMRRFSGSAITLTMVAFAIGLPLAAGCADDDHDHWRHDHDRAVYREGRYEPAPAGYRYPERRGDNDWDDRGRWDRGYEGRWENGRWDRDDRGYY